MPFNLQGEKVMTTSNRRVRAAQSAIFAGLLSLAIAAPALAGGCPADKVGSNALPGAAKAPVGVTEMELAYIDLGKESVNLPQRRLRYRHMEIQPGGVVPLHSHADRPALIMVNQGQIFEYSSQCTVPIVHKAGEIARESNGLMHWWKNEGNVVVVLTIADIVNDKKPDTMMPMM
jgi:quercetin dioxygenase-like cupin family protein